MTTAELYAELEGLVREEALLGSISAVLEWDEEISLPPAAVETRGRQQALLAGLLHQRATDPRRGELLVALGERRDLDPDAATNVQALAREHARAGRLPRALVEEQAETTAVAAMVWADARADRDFAPFAPHLERLVTLARAEAACLAPPGGEPYDALLDAHEEGLTGARLDAIFAVLGRELPPLVERARVASAPDDGEATGDFPIAAQRALAERIAVRAGYELEGGRVDAAVHPFTISLGPGDCRITGRWDARRLEIGLFTVLHEVGHALYEQGLDRAQWGMPCGAQVSDGLDEAQARMWENLVGRHPAFWRWLWPELVASFPALAGRDRDRFLAAIDHIRPGPTRASADEVTYNLHVMIRVELERALLADRLAVRDLPAAWDERYQAVLGVSPRDPAEGCLQDGHWASGMFGYFPCYTLGDVYATALFSAAERALGPFSEAFADGDLHPLRDWLRAHVYHAGGRQTANDLVAGATGGEATADALVARLRAKVDRLVG